MRVATPRADTSDRELVRAHDPVTIVIFGASGDLAGAS